MKINKAYLIILLICILMVGGFVLLASKPAKESSPKIQNTPTKKIAMDNKASDLTIDKNKSYTAILQTDAGDITIELSVKNTPVTVNNFVNLSRKNFYNNTIFHRVIKGFMIQGGDPTGTGTGGPGYKFDDEEFTGEYIRGTVAMANSGPNTNGSQFFIMHQDNTQMPKNYVIFGKVTSGLDIIDKIASAPNKPEGEGSSPVSPIKIKSVEVVEK